ncbi:MAG: helix-turn-helix transcriptional regulator [Spirochaetota bacterium]
MTNEVKRVRRERRLRQQDLADRAGVSRQTIISIERGRFRPSVELALKLARELECTVEELFRLEHGA